MIYVEWECNAQILKSHFLFIGPVSAVEISPMLPPQSGEKTPENLTQWLLENLLNLMVSEVTKVEWGERERREFSFSFLFNKFKEHYLLNIFPHFSKDTNIYEPCLGKKNTTLILSIRAHLTKCLGWLMCMLMYRCLFL